MEERTKLYGSVGGFSQYKSPIHWFKTPGKPFPRNRSYLVDRFNHPDSQPIQSGKNGKDIPYEESNIYKNITDRIKRAKPVTIRPTQTVEMTQTVKKIV
uniref:Uncharacterized protein n=1 Tax=Picea glauca TaxID=3330 RepID=A0A101M2D2_PICGL|nr:hypothetical protein ABT39_MTgene3013 [Picea glauca]QHR91916.1 hypothetical protein Q903MT_gene5952 [Picea sitchensis]